MSASIRCPNCGFQAGPHRGSYTCGCGIVYTVSGTTITASLPYPWRPVAVSSGETPCPEVDETVDPARIIAALVGERDHARRVARHLLRVPYLAVEVEALVVTYPWLADE